jgi:putative spermidine/putrescine transport system ATP-binding protein
VNNDFQELRLDGVTRRFNGGGRASFNAVSGLTLTIKRGDFIALLGPSGCGKSTALNLIAGLLPLSEGGIWLDDERIDALPPEKRGFGMVFQNYALFPHMSVVRNIDFGLRMRRMPAAEIATRVANVLKLVQLVGQENKLPGQLSGGQQQRVAIARAIVIEPPLVLMDEPLSNLDAKLRLETRSEIRRIHRDLARTTIYVTHDQEEAMSLADRILVMIDGIVQQIATPEEIYAQPANLAVATFMGYRNLLELAVDHQDGERVTLAGPDVRITGTRKLPLANGRACVAMRPEEMVVGDGPGGANTISVHIDGVEYCGRDSLLDVTTGSGIRMHVRTNQRFATGETVRVHVPVERALVYPPA